MNRALRGAYLKGQKAALQGDPTASCPYKDVRGKKTGHVTFSRALLNYWFRGYHNPTLPPEPVPPTPQNHPP